MKQTFVRVSPFRFLGALIAAALLLAASSLGPGPVGAQQADSPACEVTGTWTSSWGDMELTQSGSGVTGNYTWDSGTIEGSISGSILTGKWREAPSYSEPNDAGDIVFTFAPDCASMTGKWRYGSSGTWFEDWSGTRLQSEYGVIERDGNLYIVSPPDAPLSIERADLPAWARSQIVTVGAVISTVGFPDHVTEGDPRVLLGGRPVARLGDGTAHGGSIVEGSPTIFINGIPAAFAGGFATSPMIYGLVPAVGGPINPDCDLVDAALGTASALQNCLAEYSVAIQFLEDTAQEGDTVLQVDSTGFAVGDGVVIASDANHAETARVASTGSIVLDRPLTQSFPAGSVVTRVPDEHVDQVPPPPLAGPAAGSFTPDLVPGVNLTTYSGGTVAELTSDAAGVGVTSIAVASGGKLVILVVGAPAFVNAAFEAQFTAGVPPATAMIVLVR